nr:hydroxyethylthiazole kinase [Pajaroellobacter abortibovis]
MDNQRTSRNKNEPAQQKQFKEIVSLSNTIVLNIKTLNVMWIKYMKESIKVAQASLIPVVLDPVGAGAAFLRTTTDLTFLKTKAISALQANTSEIPGLYALTDNTKGVESTLSPDSVLEEVRHLSIRHARVVCVSGAEDYIIVQDKVFKINNGHQLMTHGTGMGCVATSLMGAFLAVQPDLFRATISAMNVIGIVGELAAEQSTGPGNFSVSFLDISAHIKKRYLIDRLRGEDVHMTSSSQHEAKGAIQ